MRVIAGSLDQRFDLIVVGSGAGGLASAAAAARSGSRVLVIEKSALLGGTSAISGGMIWIPGTRQAQAAGLTDSVAQAAAYVKAIARGRGRDELIDIAVHGARAIAFFEDRCGLRFDVLEDFPDYRQDLPGAAPGGRTLEPALYDSSELGSTRQYLRTDGRAPFTMQEYERWGAFTNFPWDVLAARTEKGIYAKGRALVGRLLASCLRDNVTLAIGARVSSLTVRNQRVAGVSLDEGTLFAADRTVVASGGFEWNHVLADSLVASRIHAMCSPPSNTGDGLTMAQRIGAMTRGTREAWWAPMALVGDTRDGQPIGTLLRFERQGPGSIMIDQHGKRFANESQNYNDLARALHAWDPNTHAPTHAPAHIMVDSTYLRRYGLFDHRTGAPTPDYLLTAESVADLATAMNVPRHALEATLRTFNAAAITGADLDFGRGESAYDKYWGDQKNPWPNPSLAPLTEPPFFALPVVNGVFGTNGGIATDGSGRVLDVDGHPIRGLCAVGNVTESAYAAGYPGAGATLGPILALAYEIGTAAPK